MRGERWLDLSPIRFLFSDPRAAVLGGVGVEKASLPEVEQDGVRANGQLRDWLNLLLLPVVPGAIPLLQPVRHVTHGVVIVA